MDTLTFDDLLKACTVGGASTLVSVTNLEPAAGEHASVAPAKFSEGRESVFAFETRFIDGKPVLVVVLDSKQSQGNRAEAAVMQDIRASHPLMSRLPRIEVNYGDGYLISDLELPHRFTDGHIRAGEIKGVHVTQNEVYRAMRNSTTADLSMIMEVAPAALVFGAWDATRKSNQVRLRSALVGEIIGVLANQDDSGQSQQSKRGGARVDPVAMSVKLDAAEMAKLVDAQESELSEKTVDKLRESIKKSKKGAHISASPLGLGGIPPQLENLGGVACRKIIRSWVLSFATLRQLRFGGPEARDVAGRVLLAAFGLAAMARAERELYLRANCDLVESGAPMVTLDERYGKKKELEPVTVELADKLLDQAIKYADSVGVAKWEGQVLAVTGNAAILKGASDTAEGEE